MTLRNRLQSPAGLIVAFAVLGAAVLASYARLRSQERAVAAAAHDLHTCAKLVADIKGLRHLPQFALFESDTRQTIADHIQQAVQQSNLPAPALIHIQPQSPSRLGDSPYRIHATRLELRQVTLQQLIRFARGLVDEDQGLTVRDLRLWDSTGAESAGPELWSAEITLTQLTYSS